jgi:23S rRNA pseudouridine2605 synthase
MPERLHKYLARCGAGSRRQCESFMAEGLVKVNGEPVRQPGAVIDPATDRVEFRGRPVRPPSFHYLMLNKPPGYVCTSHDPRGRPRAIDLVPREFGRLYNVGRLDAESEGLLLITNDGDFAHRMMHPSHGKRKTYLLWLDQPLAEPDLAAWKKGIHSHGERLRVLSIRAQPRDRAGFPYRIELGEGRNRHLRRMAEASDKKVLRLQRIAIGSLALGPLKRGAWRPLTAEELDRLED